MIRSTAGEMTAARSEPNPILVAFREYVRAWPSSTLEAAREWASMSKWEIPAASSSVASVQSATPAQVEDARRVLTRLAARS